jgi:hypothetical protein
MKFKKESGFSLVEIMVAAGLIGGIALVVAQLSKQGTKVTAKFQFDTELNLITNEMNELLSDPITCTASLAPFFEDPKGIVEKLANGKFAIGNFYGATSSVKLNSYDMDLPLRTDPNFKLADSKNLKVNFLNKEILKDSGKRNIVTKVITINYILDPGTKKLQTCKAISSVSDVWKKTTDGKGIFYVGTVGINWPYSGAPQTDPKTGKTTEQIDLDVRHADVTTLGKEIKLREDGTDPTTGQLYTAAGGTIRGGKFLYISDQRLKKNVSELDHSLEKVLSLRGVSFNWKDNNQGDVGFIAQEVQKSIPEVVHEGSENLSVDYSRLVPFLVEAIKSQQKEINKLKKEIQESKRQSN